MEYNTSIQMQELRIEELKSEEISNEELIANYTMRLPELQTDLNSNTYILQGSHSINQTARILDLELRINQTTKKMKEHRVMLSNQTGKT